MNATYIIMLMAAVFGGAVWQLYLKDELKRSRKGQPNALYIIGVLAAGVIAHIICAAVFKGHKTDMACFSAWSDRIFRNGIGQFYNDGGFHDYPPGYVYIMYVLGAVKTAFNMQDGPVLWVWLKLPAIIADMVTGWLVYKIASKKFTDAASAVMAGLLVLNPAVIMNSSTWGQVDSILGLFCVLAIYCTAERKFIPAFFWFAAGVLIKPQAAFFAPVIIFGLIDELFIREKFSVQKLIKYILWAAAAVAAMFILFMPFGENPIKGISTIVGQYLETLGEYNYATVNAFNIYAAFGMNWEALTPVLSVIGYGMYAVIIAFSAVVFFKSKNPARHYLVSFILVFSIYMLTVKMHERYAFPGIFMLIFALALVPSARTMTAYGLFSLSQMYNMAWALFIYDAGNYWSINGAVAPAGWINVIIFAVCMVLMWQETIRYAPAAADKKAAPAKSGAKAAAAKPAKKAQPEKEIFELSGQKERLGKWDFIAMAGITVIYAVIALYNLGNMYAPESEIVLSDTPVTVDMGRTADIDKIEFFLGARHLDENRAINIDYLDEDGSVVKSVTENSGSVFYWNDADAGVSARYIELSTDHVPNKTDPTDLIYVKELCILDAGGGLIAPVNAKEQKLANLFDEQDKFTEGKSYMSETYFDEIYHGRTAYEFLHKMTVYEWTHPPLGKVFIGWGILACGMNPFGWRIVGTLFGIFMVPVIFLFARRLLRYRWLAIVCCLLFTFDFMHFTQTRIATIDVYVTAFVMLMYYFMYRYSQMSFYDTPLIKTLIPLGLSGIFFGLAVASKWTGLYAGAGLAIIFFAAMYKRYMEYINASDNINLTTQGIDHKYAAENGIRNIVITLGFCVVMFVIVPIVIYTMSYIPYFATPSGHGLATITENAQSMLTYHGKTVVSSTHPYSSHWYEWPIMYRPLWYFSNSLDNGMVQGISAFGNPAVWWIGIGAVAYTMAIALMVPLRRKDYYGQNKYVFAGVYALIFLLISVWAHSAGAANEKLERLFPCVVFYSIVMVAAFLLVLTYDKYIKADSAKIPAFLLIGYFSQLVPWIPILRTTYIYHYFPMVAFTVLMTGYSFKTFYDSARNKKAAIIAAAVLAAIAVALFILFYPVISGHPVNYDFANTWMKWFKSWVLVPSPK